MEQPSTPPTWKDKVEEALACKLERARELSMDDTVKLLQAIDERVSKDQPFPITQLGYLTHDQVEDLNQLHS